MNLTEYSSNLPIFIDANIFLDYTLPNTKFGDIISDFLEKVELQLISAITTPAVLNEVSYLLASDLGRAYNLLPIDALHLSAMRRSHVRDIATRDRDFERVDGIVIWTP